EAEDCGDKAAEEQRLAADQEQHRQPDVVEQRPPRPGLAVGAVPAARGGRWRRDVPVAAPRALNGESGHQRIPTRNAETMSGPTIVNKIRKVWRVRASLVIPCQTPGGPAGPADRGATRTERAGPRRPTATPPGGFPARRRPRRGRTRRRSRPGRPDRSGSAAG